MVEYDYFDVIIVGAGVLGTAIGKSMIEDNEDLSIVIIDKYPAAGQGNTSKSNACYRNIFSTEHNIKLSNSSIEYYRHLQNTRGINLELNEFGYLWLLSKNQYQLWNSREIEVGDDKISFFQFLEKNNVEFKLYDQTELQNKMPLLSCIIDEKSSLPLVNIEYGLLGKKCGALSPDLLVKAYENMFTSFGGKTLYNSEVTEILLKEKGKSFDLEFQSSVWKDIEVAGVKIRKDNKEKILLSNQIILATGAWVQQLLDPIGIDTMIRPKKRQLFRICELGEFVTNTKFPTNINSIPFIILPVGGVFLKPVPKANCVVVGSSDDIGRRFETRIPENMKRPTDYNQYLDNPKGEEDFYIYNLLPILNSYLPDTIDEFTQIHTPSAGMYSYSYDKNPVISRFENLDNLIICSGASGSGIMKADAIARITTGLFNKKQKVELFDGSIIEVNRYGLKDRQLLVEKAIL